MRVLGSNPPGRGSEFFFSAEIQGIVGPFLTPVGHLGLGQISTFDVLGALMFPEP